MMGKKTEEPKLAAAVSLGRRGGSKTSKLYGKAHYRKMAKIGAATKVERYGREEFYALVRFGYKPSQMTERERDAALAKIRAHRESLKKRKA